MSVPIGGPTLSKLTGLSVIGWPLHHGADFLISHGPELAVSAPGKPMKSELKLRFSCSRITTCLIFAPPAGFELCGIVVVELLQAASKSTAANPNDTTRTSTSSRSTDVVRGTHDRAFSRSD